MIFQRKKLIVLVASLCCLVLVAGCSNNPCEDVKCPDICHDGELWGQVCDNGKCVDYKRIDNCSITCGCNPEEIASSIPASTTDDPCSQIICDNICEGDELWSSKCINGECVKNKVLLKCSSKCGCEPYIFSELPYPDATYLISGGLAQVYNFKEGDKIRIILTCRKNSCYDSPNAYYIFAGNRDLTQLGEERLRKIETPNEWDIKESGNYLIAISNEYYMKIGYLYEK